MDERENGENALYRSFVLLTEMLDKEQLSSLLSYGYFCVKGKYRLFYLSEIFITHSIATSELTLQAVLCHCRRTNGLMTRFDRMLAEKLVIESDEFVYGMQDNNWLTDVLPCYDVYRDYTETNRIMWDRYKTERGIA